MRKTSRKFQLNLQNPFRLRLVILVVCILFLSVTVGTAVYLYFQLPDLAALRDENPTSSAYTRLKCPTYRVRTWTPLFDISPFLTQAVLRAEDPNFFMHGPVYLSALKKAFQENLKHRKLIWGGSTITMQLARNLYLYPDRSVTRKTLEILLSYRLEDTISKQRILEIYLNIVEWGPCIFGITNASKYYFGKKPIDLAPQEAAYLASILPNPILGVRTGPRSQFNMRGANLFRRLTRGLLPEPPENGGPGTCSEHCKERLDTGEVRMVDDISVKFVSAFGSAMALGKAQHISLSEAMAVLEADEVAFLEDLLERLYCGGEGQTCHHYVPKALLVALALRAQDDHVPIEIRWRNRVTGYDIFLLLRELRRYGYCMSGQREVMRDWSSQQEGRMDGRGADFDSAVGSGPASSTDEILQWLRSNIPGYAYHLPAPTASRFIDSLEIPGIRADVLLMEVTAYCSCKRCCGWERKWGLSFLPAVYSSGPKKGRLKRVGITTDGSRATLGTIAADITRYPFGTVMCVPGYECGEVRDTGSAILIDRIDVFFNSHQMARAWGRRWLPVMVFRKEDQRPDHSLVVEP